MRRLLPLLTFALLAGCAAAGDPLRVTRASPAAPAVAPVPSASPAGKMIKTGHDPAAVAVEVGAKRLAVADSAAVRVLDVNGRLLAEIPTGAQVTGLVALPGGGFRAVAGSRVLTLPDGPTWTLPAAGTALAVHDDGWTAVSLPDRGQVIVLDPAGAQLRTIGTGGRPTAVALNGRRLGVIDPSQSSLTVFDATTGAREEALRAGDGATGVVAADAGRFVAVDTRDGELLVFDSGPLVLRQRHPAAGAPYGAAYDPTRHTLWVTLTGRNEVVGYDLSGGAPREVARHPTARQPDAVAVDPRSGAVLVTARVEGLVQLIGA